MKRNTAGHISVHSGGELIHKGAILFQAEAVWAWERMIPSEDSGSDYLWDKSEVWIRLWSYNLPSCFTLLPGRVESMPLLESEPGWFWSSPSVPPGESHKKEQNQWQSGRKAMSQTDGWTARGLGCGLFCPLWKLEYSVSFFDWTEKGRWEFGKSFSVGVALWNWIAKCLSRKMTSSHGGVSGASVAL